MYKIDQVKDYATRTLIYVIDDAVPESYHLTAGARVPHTGTAPPGISSALKPYEWCKNCHHDNPIEFQWDNEEGRMPLNKWGNPTKLGEKTISFRNKTWDELYTEIDAKMGTHVIFGSAPRQVSPLPNPEVEQEFAALPIGEPHSVDTVVFRKYRVEHNGQPTGSAYEFVVSGATVTEFKDNYDALFMVAQNKIKAAEATLAHAKAIAI